MLATIFAVRAATSMDLRISFAELSELSDRDMKAPADCSTDRCDDADSIAVRQNRCNQRTEPTKNGAGLNLL